jgi:hypothetical protein
MKRIIAPIASASLATAAGFAQAGDDIGPDGAFELLDAGAVPSDRQDD